MTITDPYDVREGDIVTVRIVNKYPLEQPNAGKEISFTATGPMEYAGQGVHVFSGKDGYEYAMGGYEPFEFVKAVRG